MGLATWLTDNTNTNWAVSVKFVQWCINTRAHSANLDITVARTDA